MLHSNRKLIHSLTLLGFEWHSSRCGSEWGRRRAQGQVGALPEKRALCREHPPHTLLREKGQAPTNSHPKGPSMATLALGLQCLERASEEQGPKSDHRSPRPAQHGLQLGLCPSHRDGRSWVPLLLPELTSPLRPATQKVLREVVRPCPCTDRILRSREAWSQPEVTQQEPARVELSSFLLPCPAFTPHEFLPKGVA